MAIRAYVETSIPSFYFETRPEPQMVARREWTREWWNRARSVQTDLVTSVAVADELELPVLAIEVPVVEIVQAYIRHRVMPADPAGDALHLALASYHRCEFLVTWNCKHLANANKFGHIRRVNTLLGLLTPALVTPLELLGDTNDED